MSLTSFAQILNQTSLQWDFRQKSSKACSEITCKMSSSELCVCCGVVCCECCVFVCVCDVHVKYVC